MCCDNGGCWKARTVALGDGDPKDKPEHLCVDVVGKLPRCMDMITADDVIRRIKLYFSGKAVRYLSAEQWNCAQAAIQKTSSSNHMELNHHIVHAAAPKLPVTNPRI
jgi:hypothetical protein